MRENFPLTFTPRTELESRTVVRFQDCDPFGHLNNVRYIDFFLNARQDQIAEAYGIQVIRPGVPESWVVSRSHIAYLAPAMLMETVLIRTHLIHADESRLLVEGMMLDEQARGPKAVLWIEFTYVNITTGRPALHSEELMALFDAVANPHADTNFEERVESIKAEYRQNRQVAPAAV